MSEFLYKLMNKKVPDQDRVFSAAKKCETKASPKRKKKQKLDITNYDKM